MKTFKENKENRSALSDVERNFGRTWKKKKEDKPCFSFLLWF